MRVIDVQPRPEQLERQRFSSSATSIDIVTVLIRFASHRPNARVGHIDRCRLCACTVADNLMDYSELKLRKTAIRVHLAHGRRRA
jgi:hypothetical protein